jgi:hypothetical protein
MASAQSSFETLRAKNMLRAASTIVRLARSETPFYIKGNKSFLVGMVKKIVYIPAVVCRVH